MLLKRALEDRLLKAEEILVGAAGVALGLKVAGRFFFKPCCQVVEFLAVEGKANFDPVEYRSVCLAETLFQGDDPFLLQRGRVFLALGPAMYHDERKFGHWSSPASKAVFKMATPSGSKVVCARRWNSWPLERRRFAAAAE